MLSFLSRGCWRDIGGRRGFLQFLVWDSKGQCPVVRLSGRNCPPHCSEGGPSVTLKPQSGISFVHLSQHGSQINPHLPAWGCLPRLPQQVLIQFVHSCICLGWSHTEHLFLLQVCPFPGHAPWALKAFCPTGTQTPTVCLLPSLPSRRSPMVSQYSRPPLS